MMPDEPNPRRGEPSFLTCLKNWRFWWLEVKRLNGPLFGEEKDELLAFRQKRAKLIEAAKKEP